MISKARSGCYPGFLISRQLYWNWSDQLFTTWIEISPVQIVGYNLKKCPRPEKASSYKKKESETWTNRNATCQQHIFINSVWTILDQNKLWWLRMVPQWEGLGWPSAQISTTTACLRRRGRRYHMIQAKKIWKQLQTKALCHSSSGVNLRKWLLPHSRKVLSVSTLLTAFSRFTVYNPQSTYINLYTCKRPQLFANRCCSASKKHQGPAQPHEIKEK